MSTLRRQHSYLVVLALLVCSVGMMHTNAGAETGSFLKRANALYDKGEYRGALDLYRKAIIAGENNTIAYFNIANSYFQLDSIAQSIVYYRAVTDEAPDFLRGHLNLAIAYYSLDDMGNCIAAISRALEIEPENSKGQMIQAAAFRRAGAYPEAITAFEKILARDRSNVDVYIALGEMLRDLGDISGALVYLEQYPENGQNAVYVQSLITDIVETEGTTEKLLYQLERFKEISPDNRWTWYRICTLHEKNGNQLLAFEAAKKALVQFPDFAEVALFAGNCAFSLELLPEAEYFYTMAKKMSCPGAVAGLDNVARKRNSLF